MKNQNKYISVQIWSMTCLLLSPFPTYGDTKIQQGQIKTYMVGTTLDLSRGAHNLGKNVKNEMEIVFDNANKEHRIPGLRFELDYYNDEYEPEQARDHVEKMIAKKIDILLNATGGATGEAYLDLIKEKKIVSIFPYPSIPNCSELKYCINFGPTYIDIAKILTNYVVKHLKPKNVAILYQDDFSGKTLLEESIKILDKVNIKTTLLPFERNYIKINKQINDIKKKIKPDCIGLFGTPVILRKIINKLGDPIIKKKNFFVVLQDTELEKFMSNQGMKFIACSDVPNPTTSTFPIVVEYKNAIKGNNDVNIDISGFHTYICTSIFVDTLAKMKEPITKKSIISMFESIKNYKFKGLNLSFDPTTRQLSNIVWIRTMEGEWKPIPVGEEK